MLPHCSGAVSDRKALYELRAERKKASRKVSRVAVWALLSVLPFAVIGCNSASDDRGTIASAVPTSGSQLPDSVENIPGQYPDSNAVAVGGAAAPIGGCVSLRGPRARALLSPVDCQDPRANYRVIQRVAKPHECVGDADRQYYQNDKDGEWTACLDLAWNSRNCISFESKDLVSQVDCADSKALNRERPTQLLLNSATAAGCTYGGFAHPIRRFTVCTETQN